MKELTVTFETKCWERDWQVILDTDFLRKQIRVSNYRFDRRVLYINNCEDYELVKKAAQRAVDDDVIDTYYVVKDYAEEVLNFFNLTKDDFKGGYYYSIAELTGIYLCKTDYLVHFSGDSRVVMNKKIDWISDAKRLLIQDNRIIVVNPTWNFQYLAARRTGNVYDNYYLGSGFSDQCYMIRASDFKNDIYHFQNSNSDKYYPKYGGELFEKRCGAYLASTGKIRATDIRLSYISRNINGIDDYNYMNSTMHKLIDRILYLKNDIKDELKFNLTRK